MFIFYQLLRIIYQMADEQVQSQINGASCLFTGHLNWLSKTWAGRHFQSSLFLLYSSASPCFFIHFLCTISTMIISAYSAGHKGDTKDESVRGNKEMWHRVRRPWTAESTSSATHHISSPSCPLCIHSSPSISLLALFLLPSNIYEHCKTASSKACWVEPNLRVWSWRHPSVPAFLAPQQPNKSQVPCQHNWYLKIHPTNPQKG